MGPFGSHHVSWYYCITCPATELYCLFVCVHPVCSANLCKSALHCMHSVHLHATESPKNPMEEWWSVILVSLGWFSDIKCQHFFTHNRGIDTQGGIDPSKRGACLARFEFCRYQGEFACLSQFCHDTTRSRESRSVPRVPPPSLRKQLPQRRHRHDTTVQRALLHIAAQHPEPAEPAIVLQLLSRAPDFTQEGRSDPQV